MRELVGIKTGRRLLIPLHRDLVATLAAAKREHISILTTMFGKPFTVDGFSQWMRDAITEAGLPLGCQPHDCARRLAVVSPRPVQQLR
jgi:enterobacteria phage integrase